MKFRRSALIGAVGLICFLVGACAPERELTRRGSEAWSRGVVIGEAGADSVAVAVHGETTFVASFDADRRLQLAQLDAVLNLTQVTNFDVTATYPDDLRLRVEGAHTLHASWLDSWEGVRRLVYTRLAPAEEEPIVNWHVTLSDDAHHVWMEPMLPSEQIAVFWSDDEAADSGVRYQAFDLSGEEIGSMATLTDSGWQPGVGRDGSGALQLSWLEQGEGAYVVIWRAGFDPASRVLHGAAPVTQVRVRRAQHFLGPALGAAGERPVVAWSIGRRHSSGLGTSLDFPTSENEIAAGLGQTQGSGSMITSDYGEYVMVSPETGMATTDVLPLTWGHVTEIWQAPQVKTSGGQMWAYFSAWVAWRSNIRMQVVLVPFSESGPGEPQAVTKTRPLSVKPGLAVAEDDTLRIAWAEALGGDAYRVVVASNSHQALAALGGFYLLEWLGDVANFLFENVSLLGYAPYVIGWAVFPLGVLILVTALSPTQVRGRWVVFCLAIAIVLHFASKQFLAPALLAFGSDPVEIGLFFGPIVLGIGLMGLYWWKAREPLLPIAYLLFLAVDGAATVFVMIPRLLWAF